MQLTVKTLLNKVHPLKDFAYEDVRLTEDENRSRIEVRIRSRQDRHGRCSGCRRSCATYDHLSERRIAFVPLWLITVALIYTMRRVECPECGIKVEEVSWICGKRQMARAYMQFLAGWARRLSWREVARCFGTSWEAVYRSVDDMVNWGLKHRSLSGITAIGVDEIHWGKGRKADSFLTVVYQIDLGCKHLLWIGRKRTEATLRQFFVQMGPQVSAGIGFVCSDMWKPHLNVIAKKASGAMNVLDPFHMAKKLNEAVDAARREETAGMRKQGLEPALKNMRWALLKRWKNLRRGLRVPLRQLLQHNLKTVRAYLLKEDFTNFWHYRSLTWAKGFPSIWTRRALQSRIEPMRKVAQSLRSHQELIFNWFRARKQFNSGVVEGLNNKIRVVARRSYGFRTYHAMELALYHTLGNLSEPELTHRFC